MKWFVTYAEYTNKAEATNIKKKKKVEKYLLVKIQTIIEPSLIFLFYYFPKSIE